MSHFGILPTHLTDTLSSLQWISDGAEHNAMQLITTAWFENWQESLKAWWLLTPFRDGLRACFHALGAFLAASPSPLLALAACRAAALGAHPRGEGHGESSGPQCGR